MNRISGAWHAKKQALANRLPEKGSFGWIMMMMGLASIPMIILPFTFWFIVWQGASLPAEEVETAFAEPLKPGQAGAILLRIAEKISRGDDATTRWYPKIVELSHHQSEELRRTVAWTMGKDPRSAEFKAALHTLLEDKSPKVKRAAAISLAAFGDPAARGVLIEAVGLQTVKSPFAGSLQMRIQPKDSASPDTTVARIGDQTVDAGIAGTVKRWLVNDGDLISRGQNLLEIVPPAVDVVDSLRALSMVGNSADAPVVRKCVEDALTDRNIVEREVERTLRAIGNRVPAAASGTGVAKI